MCVYLNLNMLVCLSAYVCLQVCVCASVCVHVGVLAHEKLGVCPSCLFIDNAMHCHSACFSLVIERPSVVYWGDLVKGKLRGSLF